MFSPEQLMHWVMIAGYIGVFGILFAETGLFIGFFLPGDSLLFIAGLLAGQGMFNILGLAGGGFIAAVLGYGLAYFFGAKLGDWLSHRADSFWFKKRYLVQAHDFYEKHGGKALVLGRLLPIIRTFVPIVAGMARMSWLRYGLWNLLGAGIWVWGLLSAGYFIGNRVPGIEQHLLPITLGIVIVSALPTLIPILKNLVRRFAR